MAKVKMTPCSKCGKKRPPWRRVGKDVLCMTCSGVAVEKTPKPTARSRAIKPRSSKRGKLDVLYKASRDAFIRDHPVCQANLPGCTIHSTEVHHTYSGKDRQTYYLDSSTWLATCRNCHSWIHKYSKEARVLGYLK